MSTVKHVIKKTIELIGVPTDLGANLRGANMGPAAVRIAGIKDKLAGLGYPVVDTGDIAIPVRETLAEVEIGRAHV